jgi:hypothetical integral membrane protein (TIGR02206 family)
MQFFSSLHLFYFLILMIASIFSIRMNRFPLDSKIHNYFRYGILVFITFNEIAWTIYRDIYLDVPIRYNLPLHLCDFAFLVGMIALAMPRNTFLIPICYYIGIGASLLAMLFPEITEEGFIRHIAIARYFFTHIAIFSIGLYLTFGRKYYPTLKDVVYSFLVLLIYMGLIAIINSLLGTNYVYLQKRPDSVHFLAAMSQSVYIFGSILFAMITMLVLHIPFWIRKQ